MRAEAWLAALRLRHAVALYLVLAFVITWPAWLVGGLIGGGDQPDWTGTAWAYWWTGEALLSGQSPFVGTADFYPVGLTPVAQYNLLDALIFWPLLRICGPQLGYNLAAVASLTSAAVGAHGLARAAGASALGAVLAGVALESSSFLIVELTRGRLSQVLLIFWLLALAGIFRIATGRSGWPGALRTGVLAAAASLTYWYYGLFLAFAAVPIALLALGSPRRVVRLGEAAGLCLLLCLPYAASLVGRYAALPGVGRELESWMDYGDLGRQSFDLSMAISQSSWPGWPLLHVSGDIDDMRMAVVWLVLAGVGLLSRRGWVWLSVGGVGWVLTLGPYLKSAEGELQRLALPWLWLHDHLPFFERMWWPQRAAILPLAAAAVLGALGLDRLTRSRPAAGVVLIGALLVEVVTTSSAFPARARPPRAFSAALYAQVDGPIITTPVLSEDEFTRHLLWMQIHHHQPILGGLGEHLPAHRPSGYDVYVRERRLLRALERLSVGYFRGFLIYPRDVQELIDDGFAWAVVDPHVYSPGLEEEWSAAFSHVFGTIWGEPDVVDGLGAAWRVRPIDEAVRIPEIPAVELLGPRRGRGSSTRTAPAAGRVRPEAQR